MTSVVALSLTACASPTPRTPDGGTAPGDGHGAITGAAEVAEPQLGLTTIDSTGAVSHLDLLDESVTDLGRIGAPEAMTTDGRYLFAQTTDGVQIIDSGVWTWDHVDHFHYYRAEPRLLGSVAGRGAAAVATTTLSTSGGTGVFFSETGDAVLLDTGALSKGEVVETFRLTVEPHAGMIVPVGSYALVTEARSGAAATVVGYTDDGRRTGVREPCADAAGTITTRVGAVVGCRDAALLASVQDGELVVERIPYPAGTTVPAAERFANREGRPVVAALAGTEAIWLLDTRQRSWALLPAPEPLVDVVAVDDADHTVLALTTGGRMLVLDGEDGSLRAQTEPIVAESLATGWTPRLIADQQRAYLSAPAEQRLYEVDFADDARIARSFETPAEPVFFAETGR